MKIGEMLKRVWDGDWDMSNSKEKPDRELDLAQAGIVEDLVAKGRLPILAPGQSGREKDGCVVTDEVIFCFIPPVGTIINDTYQNTIGGGMEFFAPDGTSRGLASLQVITPKVAKDIEQRLKALQKIH